MVDEYIVDYDEYAGLGSGSIGYMDGRSYANTFDIPQYIEMLDMGKLPLMAARDFTPTQQARYDFLMKLFGLKLDISFLTKKIWLRGYLVSLERYIRLYAGRRVALQARYFLPYRSWQILLGHNDEGILHCGQQFPRLLPGQVGGYELRVAGYGHD